MKIAELHALVEAVCPIVGIDSDGGIDFKLEATEQQRQDAQAVMDAHIAEVI